MSSCVVRASRAHFRPLDLVALLVGVWRSFLGGWCHPTLSLYGCFKRTLPMTLLLLPEILLNSA